MMSRAKLIRNLPLALVFAAVILLGVGRSHFAPAMVVGYSMRPALDNGDLLVVDKKAYIDTRPRRGDIVVARSWDEWIVKRVVGLPGETVELRSGELYIDGQRFQETYPRNDGLLTIGEGLLDEDRFALLGDNRIEDMSHAIAGPDQILGKVVRVLRMP